MRYTLRFLYVLSILLNDSYKPWVGEYVIRNVENSNNDNRQEIRVRTARIIGERFMELHVYERHVSRTLGKRGAMSGRHDFLRTKPPGGSVRQQRSATDAEFHNHLWEGTVSKDHLSSSSLPLS